MHIGSVLKREASAQVYGHVPQMNASASGSLDAKEEAKRRIAAEKELKSIFERTYGASKKTRYREAREKDYRGRPELTEEEAARNEARNQEIKALHEHKTDKRDDKPVMILIDGYNIIFADEYLKDLFARDGGAARDQLLDRLSNYAGYTGYEVTAVFDAYNVPMGEVREEERNGVRVVFTAENEPADIRMGIMTAAAGDRRIYVVSSDNLVQQDAWTHGALRISSREFLAELSRTEQEIREHLKCSD
jgi:predicted RNA-binding protein with PIN domain